MADEYDGTEGDDALAAGYDVMDGSEQWKFGWKSINKTRDYIAQLASSLLLAIAGKLDATEAAGVGEVAGSKLVRYKANTRVPVSSPIADVDAANKAYVDGAVSSRAGAGGVPGNFEIGGGALVNDDLNVGEDIFAPNLTAANSGYVVMYHNGNGRLARGASSRRYKHEIRDAGDLGDLFAAPLREFKMNDGDGSFRVGYIAEELEELGLERFVVYMDGGAGEMVADSIDFISFLLAQVAQLHERVKTLEARDA